MASFIPVNQPLLDGNEKKYLNECIDSGWISSEGPFVGKFEAQFSERIGRNYGVAVCNGTAAIDAAIVALGIAPGDEVIMPTFTIISCINQIIRCGAVPVLVDSDPITWNMSVDDIEAKVNSKTKAIFIVHIYGLPADVNPILGIAKKYGLKVIEDAAEMHGQCYRGKPCGSFGDVSIFSFYPNKHITTGEGGMIVTNSEQIALNCQSLRNLCFQSEKRFIHQSLGWNMRMTNLQAAVGLAQLERLDEFVSRKKAMGSMYNKLLNGLPGVQLPQEKTDYAENIYWVYGLVIDPATGLTAETVMKLLLQAGIGTRPFFYPMHQQPILKQMGYFQGQRYPVSEKMYQQGFYIPSGLAISSEQIERVAIALWDIFK